MTISEYLSACEHSLSSFSLATEAEIKKIIMNSPSKSCQLDPIPTWLLKECIDVLITPITTLINACINSSTMPRELKIAHITPLPKKINLIIEILKNYRPVSGLSFISKIIEKHVDCQMTEHDKIPNLSEKFQSAYTECCSTETAHLRVHNELLVSLDTKGLAGPQCCI